MYIYIIIHGIQRLITCDIIGEIRHYVPGKFNMIFTLLDAQVNSLRALSINLYISTFFYRLNEINQNGFIVTIDLSSMLHLISNSGSE
jgi:hypothetical protein